MFDIIAVTEPALIDAVYENVGVAQQEDIAAILNISKLREWQLADVATQQTLMQYLATLGKTYHIAAGEQLTNTLYNLAAINRLAMAYMQQNVKNGAIKTASHTAPQPLDLQQLFEQSSKLANLNAALVSKIGYDQHGRQYAQQLRDIGMDISKTPFAADDTGLCISMQFNTGKLSKAMATRLCSFKTLSHCSTQNMETICRQTRYLLIEGYLLSSETEQVMALLAVAKRIKQTQQLTIGLTLSAQKVAQDIGLETAQQFDFIAANEEEFNALLGSECTFEQVKRAIDPQCTKTIIYTQGKNGAILSRNYETEIIKAQPIVPDLLVDVTGAGDAFLAGVLFGLLQNQSLRYCGEMGSIIAKQIVQTHGARLITN